MTRQERMALALAYQQRNRPNLGDLSPEQMTAMQAPTQQPTMSLLDRISETGAGIGKGLANTVEGMGQMVTAPIETGKEMYRNVSDVVSNPSLIVEALKQMGQKATSSPAGFGEVVGENINPRNLAKTLAKGLEHPNVRKMTVHRVESTGFTNDPSKYQGLHSPPGPDSGAPLHDLTGGGAIYPDDVYSRNQVQYYGTGDPIDYKTFSIINEMKGNPNKTVTMYRAVPITRSNAEKIAELEAQKAAYLRRKIVPAGQPEKGFYDRASNEIERLRALPEQEIAVPVINKGDWVTINRDYAKSHGESALNGKYKILTKKVKAKDLYTNGDSIHEFGYWPTDEGVK